MCQHARPAKEYCNSKFSALFWSVSCKTRETGPSGRPRAATFRRSSGPLSHRKSQITRNDGPRKNQRSNEQSPVHSPRPKSSRRSQKREEIYPTEKRSSREAGVHAESALRTLPTPLQTQTDPISFHRILPLKSTNQSKTKW